MTQDVKYLRTYQALRERFPTWEDFVQADSRDLQSVLADAGLGE
ncbi:MAG: hypothetical protein V3T08_01420 [Gemmatimonadota bacterium]